MDVLMFPLLVCSLFASAQKEIDSVWVKKNYHKWERNIRMRDGTELFTAIYIPNDLKEKHPVLIERTPYSCRPYGESNFCSDLWSTSRRLYIKEKYILVIQDVRGKWMSEGRFENIRPFIPDKRGTQTDEASDAYDAIEWIVKNVPDNNGRVGVLGISYPGFYAAMAGLSGHPALKAISPQAPVTDWFHGDDFHHNGAFFLLDCFRFFTKGFGFPHAGPMNIAATSSLKIPMNDNYATFLNIGPLKNFTKLTGDTLDFWKDAMEHPDEDEWWRSRDLRKYVKDIRPATLIVGGLFDAEDCFGSWNLYKAIEKEGPPGHFNKLVMGPWYHGQWATTDGTHIGHIYFQSNTSAWYQENIELPFFNYFLKGHGDINRISEATVFVSGENKWENFDHWPPQSVKEKELYFEPNEKLTWTKPELVDGYSVYTSDPNRPVPYTGGIHYVRTRDYMTDDQRYASRRNDVILFETEPLANDITVTGTVIANLKASISTTDADFVVKLIDVFPDNFTYPWSPPPNMTHDAGGPYPMGGYQMLVRGDIFRGRYRHSFEKPEPFTPGKIEDIRFPLNDIAHCFLRGHRIMIQVQSSWFPLADRNPQTFVNIYWAEAKDFQKSDIRVYHNSENASSIILPVLNR
jgi:putative CocE/NonD family hydrolase